MSSLRLLAVLAIATSLVYLAPNPVPAVQHLITMSGLTFTPNLLTIDEGDTVLFQVVSGTHTTTSGTACTADGIWNSGFMSSVDPPFEVTFDFNSAGSYPFYCQPHCTFGMTGTITVNDVPTGIDDSPRAPNYSLEQNFPNPFNPVTAIEYTIARPAHVAIDIYDVEGRRVVRLVDQTMGAGPHAAVWEGVDAEGAPQATGVYFYQLMLDGVAVQMKKMALIK